VDGNEARVVARLLEIKDDILTPRGKSHVQSRADRLLPRNRPGDFNQAWMDLGSLICTPRDPNCARCPLSRCCRAFETGRVGTLPVRGSNRKRKKRVQIVVAIFLNDRRMLVSRRPSGGLWSDLWEFPHAERNGSRSVPSTISEIANEAGAAILSPPRKAGTLKYELTHRSLVFSIYVACAGPLWNNPCGEREVRPIRWVDSSTFARLSVSTAHRRIHEIGLRLHPNHSGAARRVAPGSS